MGRCEVYYNLHKKCFSIRSLEKEDYGKVVMHANEVVMDDVKFVVREGGRKQVLREGRKNVHAFVRGTLVDACVKKGPITQHYAKVDNSYKPFYRATYNPYKYDSFVNIFTEEPVRDAGRALLLNQDRPVIMYQ